MTKPNTELPDFLAALRDLPPRNNNDIAYLRAAIRAINKVSEELDRCTNELLEREHGSDKP